MSARTERSHTAFLKTALGGSRFANAHWVTETGSTNDDLLALARDGAGEQVLVTDLQTAGKGRRDRVWEAPAQSSILMSTLIRDRAPEDGFWSVGAIALAASQAIGAITESPCTLKWPNDVMLGAGADQKKVAGVLAAVVDDAVVVGIGINVNWPDQVAPELTERGTSINGHRNDRTFLDRPPIVVDILRRAIGHLESAPDALRAAWKDRCSTLGRTVRLDLDTYQDDDESVAITGIAVDVAPDGGLILDRDGERTTHQVGDVVHLRPANGSS